MIRFRNPGTQYDTQIEIFKKLYQELKEYEYFNLENMAQIIAKYKLLTSYGYSGDNAIKISKTENKSLDATYNNAKMYAEVFRLLGWVAPYGEKTYPLIFTYLGKKVAELENEKILSLYSECVLGINNPQKIMEVKYNEKHRFFKTALITLEDLDNIMYKHELCLGPMSLNDDLNEIEYNKMIKYLKAIRGDYSNYQREFKSLCEELNVKSTLPDNCTRLPIAFMKNCEWIENVKSKEIYSPKTLECFRLTEKGKKLVAKLKDIKDLRLDEYLEYSEEIKSSLIRLGLYYMLKRANVSVEDFSESLENDLLRCKYILNGRELYFSPFQTITPNEINKFFMLEKKGVKKDINTINIIDNSEKISKPSILKTKLMLDNINTIYKENNKEEEKFINLVLEMSKELSKKEIIERIFKDQEKSTQDKFYPFIRLLFAILGFDSKLSRAGDNGARWDLILIDEQKSVPIEIKSPTEEKNISVKAIRQALENKIILLSRETYKTTREISSLVVGYKNPNKRSEVNEIILAFKKTYNIKIGILDLKTILKMVITCVLDKKMFDKEKFYNCEGIIEVEDRK